MHQTACVGYTRVCGWGGVSRSIFSIGNMLFSTFRSCPKIVVKPLVNAFFVPGVLFDLLACARVFNKAHEQSTHRMPSGRPD